MKRKKGSPQVNTQNTIIIFNFYLQPDSFRSLSSKIFRQRDGSVGRLCCIFVIYFQKKSILARTDNRPVASCVYYKTRQSTSGVSMNEMREKFDSNFCVHYQWTLINR
jgi:hypothetical protein